MLLEDGKPRQMTRQDAHEGGDLAFPQTLEHAGSVVAERLTVQQPDYAVSRINGRGRFVYGVHGVVSRLGGRPLSATASLCRQVR